MNLVGQVRGFMASHDLLQAAACLVVGVSGGPDSLCLLDVLTTIAPEQGLSLEVACLDHGLRPQAAEETAFVRAEAEARGWPFHTARVDTRAWAAEHGRSLEEAARELRYAFLGQVAEVVGAPAVAVAHTADDQAETVLMHFLRGSGLAGLRGMLPRTPLPVRSRPAGLWLIRPLLAVSRAKVEAYCAARSLQPRQDATNQDITFFRNRLRHVLLPELERYNPNLRAVLGRTAAVAAGEHALVAAAVAAAWDRAVRQVTPAAVVFDRAAWLALSVPEQRALLRRAAQWLLPDERNLDFTPIDQAVRFSRRAAPGRACDVLRGLRLKVTGAAVTIGPWEAAPAGPDRPQLDEAGRLIGGWRFSAIEVAAPPPPGAPADPWSEVVAADALPASAAFQLRRRRPGDRFRPLGLGGHSMKVADFLINAKIDAPLRAGWPLVTAGAGEIVWVAGLRLAEPYKITPAARRLVRLTFEPPAGSAA